MVFSYLRPFIFCAGLLALTFPALADPENGTGWVYETLDMDITFHPEDKKITVEGKATLRLEEETSFGPTLALNLNSTVDLRKKIMAFTALEGGKNSKAVLNVSPLDQSHKNANATSLGEIRYPARFKKGDEVTVTFALESIDQAFQFKVSETNAVASYEAAWYPVPVSGPNETESRLRRAGGEMRFHLPEGLHAFSNGRLISQEDNGAGVTEVWATAAPRARSFVIGPFQVERFAIEGKDFAVYLLPDNNRPDWTRGKVIPAAEMLDGLTSAIRILQDAYGPFPFESFGVVEVPNTLVNWWGALEDGFMIGTSGSLSSSKIGILDNISHEVSHAWWGAKVEAKGPGAYLLSESLANFSTRYFFEKYVGRELATHLFRFGTEGGPLDFNYSAYGYFNLMRNGVDSPLSGVVSGNSDTYNLASAKGGLFYNLLRNRIGDDAVFFGTLRAFEDKFQDTEATLGDLREAFIEALPERREELENFMARWLDGVGAPKLEAEARSTEDGHVEVTIRQVQKAEPFQMILDLDLFIDGVPVRHTVEVEGRETRVILDLAGQVEGLVLDPAHKLLIWTPDYGPYE